jgi:ankyrin repeat protein
MKRSDSHPAALISLVLALLGVLIGVAFALRWRITRQVRLDQALIAAVKAKHTEAAVALLQQGADPNARDDPRPVLPLWRMLIGWLRGQKQKRSLAPTPLLIAFMHPPYDPFLIQILLEQGADPNVPSANGWTPLLLATTQRDAPAVHLLLTYGADARKQTALDPPLVVAAMFFRDNPQVLEDFVDHGADVNQRALGGWTVLWGSTASGKKAVVKVLLAHHADTTLQWDHKTPLAKAEQILASVDNDYDRDNFREIVRLLRAAGATE